LQLAIGAREPVHSGGGSSSGGGGSGGPTVNIRKTQLQSATSMKFLATPQTPDHETR
jgi:hypothetical protein